MSRNLDADLVSRTCKIKGREGTYYLVRSGPNNSRVANLEPPRGEGFLVKTSDLHEIQGNLTFLDRVSNEMLEKNWFPQEDHPDLPWGLKQLRSQINTDDQARLLCLHMECDHYLIPPSKEYPGDVCPVHHIRCHVSGTYTYRKEEAWRNVVANRSLFEQLNSHPFKWESRTHYESSEDAMSASVLLSFKEAGLLHLIVHWITGQAVDEKDVELFMWGISVDSLQPLDLLIAARNRFERGLPQGRPASEPDIMLRVRGKLFLILEAKFGSHNSFVIPGEGRKSPISLTHDEVLNRYNDLSLKMLDRAKGKDAPVPQQLWRYAVLGEWMTTLGDPEATFYLVNLVRKGHEVQSQDTFRDLIHEPCRERFQVLTWEDLYTLSSFERKKLARLRCYLENKTLKLRQAFDLGRKWV